MGHPENPVSQGVREIFFFTAGLNEQSSMLMDLGLSAKKGIVCAASKGLGRAVAVALAREGVDLVINARSEDPLEATAESIRAETGVDVIPIVADITTEAGRAAVVAACPEPDILINNAGGPPPGDFRCHDQRVAAGTIRNRPAPRDPSIRSKSGEAFDRR